MTAAGWRAVVRSAIAPLLAEPRASASQVSQRLAGHLVTALEVSGNWVRVRGEDGYEGWVHTGYLTRVPGTAARRSRGTRRVSLGCCTRLTGGGTRALPLGAYLGPDEVVDSGQVLGESELPVRFPHLASAVVTTARLFEGTGYLWGGVTPWGADCSGFVQMVFWLHGVTLPRDAWQQAEAGAPGQPMLAALQAGELAFFTDAGAQRISHVGLGLGEGRMAHVAIGRGGFAIEQLADGRDAYVKKLRERFRLARVVL